MLRRAWLGLLLLLLPFGAAAAADGPPLDYANPAYWICRPGLNDVCAGDLSATVVEADGALTLQPRKADPSAPVDCFYVYPTVSRDNSVNSDTQWGRDEEIWATFIQAAPLAGGCRLFAPGYRQLTISGLAGNPRLDDFAFGDVRAAWHHYLAQDNNGRGVILVGHSQGSAMLKRLIAEEIDGAQAVRERLVAAYLAGVNFLVPPGADKGGDFGNIPLCHAADQFGCVIPWATYRAAAPPPPNGLFGRAAPGMRAACVNPAAPAGGTADLLAEFPAARGATIADPAGRPGSDGKWLDPAIGTIATPFAALPGLVSGTCVEANGFSWLSLIIHQAPGPPRAEDIPGDMGPEWGMHLVDMNVVMGDLRRLVASQGAAWRAAHPGAR